MMYNLSTNFVFYIISLVKIIAFLIFLINFFNLVPFSLFDLLFVHKFLNFLIKLN